MSRRAKHRTRPTAWQRRVLKDLRASARQQPQTLRVLDRSQLDGNAHLHVALALTTTGITTKPSGLAFEPVETFHLVVAPASDRPPSIGVTHPRFLGCSHVLSGHTVCLYLDPAREWDPEHPINGHNGILNRLWDWMTKAAADTFDPRRALFHAVGGVPHIGIGTPHIVVRDLPARRGRVGGAWLTRRNEHRFDLHTSPPADEPADHMPVFFTDTDLPFGAGYNYLGELLTLIDHPDLGVQRSPLVVRSEAARVVPTLAATAILGRASENSCPAGTWTHPISGDLEPIVKPAMRPSLALLGALAASAARKPDGTPQCLLLAVPHPIDRTRHLIAIYLCAEIADRLRDIVRGRTTPLITFEHAQFSWRTPMEWCFVSDDRDVVTTRRDTRRPVTAYHGKTVLVWGVGGLGSWVAEYVVRAGAAKVIVCDTGLVTRGLLVRQNYAEDDVGNAKAAALRDRLATLSDDTNLEAKGQISDDELAAYATTVDVIIDATISRAVTRRLDMIAASPNRTALIVQIATDTATGTLGIASIFGPGETYTINDTDEHVGRHVKARPSLEAYHIFWDDPLPDDEFTPTLGCSVPTFHGSAADLAGVAATLTNLIARDVANPAHGTYLVALPHSGTSPAYAHISHNLLDRHKAA